MEDGEKSGVRKGAEKVAGIFGTILGESLRIGNDLVGVIAPEIKAAADKLFGNGDE